MLTHQSQFISRFLYHIKNDDFYWVQGVPPTAEVIAQASAAAKDIIGFDIHRNAFTTLADIIGA